MKLNEPTRFEWTCIKQQIDERAEHYTMLERAHLDFNKEQPCDSDIEFGDYQLHCEMLPAKALVPETVLPIWIVMKVYHVYNWDGHEVTEKFIMSSVQVNEAIAAMICAQIKDQILHDLGE